DDDGSGIVHIAPAFGEDDAQVGRAENLPVLNPVDADATFDHRVPPWNGRFVKDADADIIAELRTRGLLVAEQPYTHSYPHCWRCGTPLIYWAKTSWFVRTEEKRGDLLAQNETIGWYPDHIKRGRFGRWLEGNIDWALSRDRYWGSPLPIWRCQGCGSDTCVGSVAELSDLAGRDLSDLDLHRPFVDDVTWTCKAEGCEGTVRRLPPVLDAWFDSGSMPSAQAHFPFADVVAGADGLPPAFPADFICEAIDQTRGWFYSLLAVNTLVFGQTPYRNVVCLGHIVDEDGQKMSKSKGNVIEPWQLFSTVGADALRWYFFSSGQPWGQRRVFEDGIRESARQTLLTLWNVHSFFVTYADLDGWRPDPGAGSTAPRPTHVLDRWVLGELDATVAEVTEALEDFDALRGATRLARFVDDLSNWYVRRSRPRFWKASDPQAHATLHHALVVTSQLLAPFCPFLADELYVALTDEPSVHLSDWPVPSGADDADLSAQMAAARRLVALGRAARTDAKAKVRQPLSRALVLHPGIALDAEVVAEIATELNVKAVDDIDTLSGLMSWTIVPNFRALGPRLGPKVNAVKQALAAADGSALQQQLEADGSIEVAGERLTVDDVEVRANRHEAFGLAEEGGWAVALDLELDDELRREGLARELVRALNDLRKETGLAVSDRIAVTIEADGEVEAAVAAHRGYVSAEVLAVDLVVGPATPDAHTITVEGNPVRVDLSTS
ncbi:MAG: class I tRNA ligase family protein, partial [Acidimicrobiales bacterium]|nr:class I tRNA ligase family protein [Acidimicrobiales bacterium]